MKILATPEKGDLEETKKLIERKPIPENLVEKITKILYPFPDKKYPAGVYILKLRNTKDIISGAYTSRAPYRIYRIYEKGGELLPDGLYDKIVDLMHSFNVNKRNYRKKVGKGTYDWDSFENDLSLLVRGYRWRVEKLLEKYGWDKKYAPYIVPLLYNWMEPQFEKQTVFMTIKGMYLEFFVTK